jgi:hypothetical protein
MKTTFKNSKGEFSKENTNYEIEIEHEICSVKIKRDGQCNPKKSNDIRVKLEMTNENHKSPLSFCEKILGVNLNEEENYWTNYQRKEGVTNIEFFSKKTWREAFKKAYDYAISELNKYDTLVKEREQALIDAEF